MNCDANTHSFHNSRDRDCALRLESCASGDGPKTGDHVSKLPFEPNEQLFYEAEFSRAIFRKLDVADFKFTQADSLNGTKRRFRQTLKLLMPWFSKQRFPAKVFSRVYLISISENELNRSSNHLLYGATNEHPRRARQTHSHDGSDFDRAKGKMSWTQRDPNNPQREPRQIITDFSGQLQDVLSAIYFIRTQPLEVGKSLEIFIGDGGRVYQVPIRVVERKRMKTILGRVDVVRVDPELFGPDRLIDSEKGHFSLWITDDSRRSRSWRK